MTSGPCHHRAMSRGFDGGAGAARRTVLGGMGLLGLASLAGCGIRLEDDAPALPGIPTRSPIPGEAALVTFLRETVVLADALSRGDSTWQELAEIHRLQARVIESALRSRGVPEALVSAATSAPSASTSTTGSSGVAIPGPTPTPPPDRRVPVWEWDSAKAAYGLVSVVADDLVPTLAAIAAARSAGAFALNPKRAPYAPTGSPLSAETVLPLLAVTREAVYGMEVVSARADRQSDRALATLGQLRVLVRAQEANAGSAAPPTPLGYALPFVVRDDATGARLAKQLLDRLAIAYAAALPRVVDDRPSAVTVLNWLGWATRTGQAWGLAPVAFPGLP